MKEGLAVETPRAALVDAIVCKAFLSGPVLRELLRRSPIARFSPTRHRDWQGREFAGDWTIDGHDPAIHLLQFVLNTPHFLERVRRLTGCSAIGSFSGRIYRMLPGAGNHLSWHDDAAGDERLIGISIDISAEPFEGGRFQLRDKVSRRVLSDIYNGTAGDAVLFRIDRTLEHRLTPLEGTAARTAAAGWFGHGASYLQDLLRHQSGAGRASR